MIDFHTRKTAQGTLVIRATGKLDGETNQYFFDCIKDEIEAGHTKIVINFEGLGYISSVGLGALVRASSRASKAGGTIYLAQIENSVLDVLRIVSFDKIFKIYPTEGEAVEAIES